MGGNEKFTKISEEEQERLSLKRRNALIRFGVILFLIVIIIILFVFNGAGEVIKEIQENFTKIKNMM